MKPKIQHKLYKAALGTIFHEAGRPAAVETLKRNFPKVARRGTHGAFGKANNQPK